MEKFKNFIKNYGLLILTLMVIFSTCKVNTLEREVSKYQKEVDSLTTISKDIHDKMFTEIEYEELMWKFLEIEEISDKNKVPINQLKLQKKGKLNE